MLTALCTAQPQQGTKQGEEQSRRYNESVRKNTVQHAILAPLKQPTGQPHGVFQEVLAHHWRAKGDAIKQQLRDWQIDGGVASEVTEVLDKLH